ncbi:hypothetical protein HDU93_000563 [Gonapodya sp. JEL0774]|nr:hypothetical protein HDU93_000563 [Gonapodya sp. JEL0774]
MDTEDDYETSTGAEGEEEEVEDEKDGQENEEKDGEEEREGIDEDADVDSPSVGSTNDTNDDTDKPQHAPFRASETPAQPPSPTSPPPPVKASAPPVSTKSATTSKATTEPLPVSSTATSTAPRHSSPPKAPGLPLPLPPPSSTIHRAELLAHLARLNRTKLRPLESILADGHVQTGNTGRVYDGGPGQVVQPWSDADVVSVPMVVVLGQYSVGKTTFIKHLLGREYPGSFIGPEPTTDSFVAVMHGPDERVIPGDAACVAEGMPFKGLARFGANFLNRFKVSQLPHPTLSHLTLIDTPGILSLPSSRRAYSLPAVSRWFADRADTVLVFFDANRLDVGEELAEVVGGMGNEEKCRVVLNKADMVTGEDLMRCYGALMWSLARVFKSPEVVRVYVGSFWERKYRIRDMADLLRRENSALMRDLGDLPSSSLVRKVNEMVRKARTARAHALLFIHLRARLPLFASRASYLKLLTNLDKHIADVCRVYEIPEGELPDVTELRRRLQGVDVGKVGKIDKKLVARVEEKPVTTIRFHRILLTGAAGGVGTQLRPRLKAYCDVLRVSDISESLTPAGEGEERVIVNLGDKSAVFKMVEGCDAIIHLGGVSVEKTWEEILQGNIAGLVNLYEAIRHHGIKRVVFASSNHTVGFYRQDQVINSRDPVRPDGFYGLSKVFGENLAQLYWDKHGIETVSVRIGSIFPKPTDRRMLATWMSYDDAERLFMAALTAPIVGHSIIFGMSDNKTVFWDNVYAKHIGYRPMDSSDSYRDEIEAKFQKLDMSDVATRHQGAAFTRTGPFFQDDGLGAKKA